MTDIVQSLPGAGIGLRQPHYREIFERRPALAFLEVHSENFFLEGGASMHALERARADGLIASPTSQPMYQHGLCTLALAEMYGMDPDPDLEKVLRKAVDLIVRCQAPSVSNRRRPVRAVSTTGPPRIATSNPSPTISA